ERLVQGDDRPVPGVEARARLVEHLTVREGCGGIDRGRHVDGCQLDLDHPPTPATDLVETGIDDQAMNPGVEPVRVTDTGQVAPGADEPLLDRVARELRVPEDQSGSRIQP